jgi:hypothetical protein
VASIDLDHVPVMGPFTLLNPISPCSSQGDLQIAAPHAALCCALKAREVQHIVLEARLEPARGIACTIAAAAGLALMLTTIDSHAVCLAGRT